ncbi:MAG: type II toxin-antitoxin system HicA family toxin [Candidatus Acetothermia bacterium]|jgi:predicted RNA binding protein YcfA (HicA-like mRNA interferase family)|nr:type II toxin-antitoxin system HicA family toxin [Candidatus Acetothermia bacterium]MDH7505929.1 type II toxin-antitoxin system HicA family toxin [Candidatus Acetothermia bacterium]
MSTIDYGKLRSLTASELVKILERDGFKRKRQRGSHHRYIHPDGRRVTVTFHHPGQTFKIGTLQSMIEKQAQWNEADLKRLGLLKG